MPPVSTHLPNRNGLWSAVKLLCHARLFATPWTIDYRAPPSLGFSRQEYWSGLPFPSPGDHPNPGTEPSLLHSRQTLYCLSHQGSRKWSLMMYKLARSLCLSAQSLRPCPTFATLWTVVCQSPLSCGLSRQEYWSGLPFPPPWYLPHPGTEAMSSVTPVLQVESFTTESPGKPSKVPTLFLF